MSIKHELIQLILATLNQEIETLTRSAQAAHEAATHEESKAEDSHDTRGLEASYLAGAQMARIETLKKTFSLFQFSEIRHFEPSDSIAIGALIQLKLEGKTLHYLLVNQGGGMSVKHNGVAVNLITPQAPVGEALLGKYVGDSIEVEVQKSSREYEVIAIS